MGFNTVLKCGNVVWALQSINTSQYGYTWIWTLILEIRARASNYNMLTVSATTADQIFFIGTNLTLNWVVKFIKNQAIAMKVAFFWGGGCVFFGLRHYNLFGIKGNACKARLMLEWKILVT